MWVTSDGYVIRLPAARVNDLAAQLQGGGEPGGCSRCAHQTVSEELGRMLISARRVGAYRHRASGRRYPVFGAERWGRPYRIITEPLYGPNLAVLGVEPQAAYEPEPSDSTAPEDEGEELEAKLTRGPLRSRTIQWSPPKTFEEAMEIHTPAVYIIEFTNGHPAYVGETFDVGDRMSRHLQRKFKGKERQYRVRIGTLAPAPQNELKVIEHAIIRTILRKSGGIIEANETARNEFKIGGDIVIKNILPPGGRYDEIRSAPASRVNGNDLILKKGEPDYEIVPRERAGV